jgi:D-arabinose 1-dehydrogenase-like Zn-dependent alcohol dehydrogenase
MAKTYKAVEVSAPGNLRIVERPIPQPGEGQVLIRVEACGICHTDALTVEGQFPGLSLPRVPGHEVAGASKRSARVSLNGASDSASASAFSVATTGTVSPAAEEILSIVRISPSQESALTAATRK